MILVTCQWIMKNVRAILFLNCAKKWMGYSSVLSCPSLAQGPIAEWFSKCWLLMGILKK